MLLLAGIITTLPSCGDDQVVGDSGACPLTIEFRGETYEGHTLAILPVEGEPLGTATLPLCDDTPNDDEKDAADQIELVALPGVSPDVAVLWISGASVLVRRDVDPLPRKVKKLLTPPGCLEADQPIELSGRWNGILGADGKTELDMVPPYDVALLVETASAPRYERAFLTVRVPPSLGTPLSESDVSASLWQGGSIQITATCAEERFVAASVAAFPPE